MITVILKNLIFLVIKIIQFSVIRFQSEDGRMEGYVPKDGP